MKNKLRMICSLVAASFILGGCLGRRAEDVRILWPPPPEKSRMEFVGVYASKDDFPKNRWQKILELIFGKGKTKPFKSPQDIFTDGWGRVFVSDRGVRKIVLFDFDRRAVDLLFDGFDLGEPLALAGDKRGTLFVADEKNKKILAFSSDGAFLHSFGNDQLLVSAEYMVVNDQNGRLYVSDSLASRIVVFDLKGNHLFSFGQHGEGEGEFHSPHGLAIDASSRVFVADAGNARIQVFDADGRFQYQFGKSGNKLRHFMKPVDLGFDSEGYLHVLDQRMRLLLTYTPSGELLLVTGTGKPSKARLGLLTPTSVYIDRDDRIYIADKTNGRFSVWQYLSKAYLDKNPISEKDLVKLKKYLAKAKKSVPEEG